MQNCHLHDSIFGSIRENFEVIAVVNLSLRNSQISMAEVSRPINEMNASTYLPRPHLSSVLFFIKTHYSNFHLIMLANEKWSVGSNRFHYMAHTATTSIFHAISNMALPIYPIKIANTAKTEFHNFHPNHSVLLNLSLTLWKCIQYILRVT